MSSSSCNKEQNSCAWSFVTFQDLGSRSIGGMTVDPLASQNLTLFFSMFFDFFAVRDLLERLLLTLASTLQILFPQFTVFADPLFALRKILKSGDN